MRHSIRTVQLTKYKITCAPRRHTNNSDAPEKGRRNSTRVLRPTIASVTEHIPPPKKKYHPGQLPSDVCNLLHQLRSVSYKALRDDFKSVVTLRFTVSSKRQGWADVLNGIFRDRCPGSRFLGQMSYHRYLYIKIGSVCLCHGKHAIGDRRYLLAPCDNRPPARPARIPLGDTLCGYCTVVSVSSAL